MVTSPKINGHILGGVLLMRIQVYLVGDRGASVWGYIKDLRQGLNAQDA